MTVGGGASGILVVDKAPGLTSFDVVALVRQQLRLRRVGHAGTLDPAAEGVLPILIGEATKLVPYLQEMSKEYLVTVRFGIRTDTLDLDGRVIDTAPVPPLDAGELTRVSRAFVGRIKQVPPMYSALHHDGQRLYELARRGIEVPRAPREVTIHALVVEEVAVSAATLRVVCGKGTYVRTLASDLGEALGYGAAVERLIRTRVGPFERADAVASGDVATATPEALGPRVRPPESALVGWPAVHLDGSAAASFLHGQPVAASPSVGGDVRFVAVYASGDRFLGVGERSADGGRIRPARVLHADHPGPRVLPA